MRNSVLRWSWKCHMKILKTLGGVPFWEAAVKAKMQIKIWPICPFLEVLWTPISHFSIYWVIHHRVHVIQWYKWNGVGLIQKYSYLAELLPKSGAHPIFIYKCIHGLAPTYLNHLISFNNISLTRRNSLHISLCQASHPQAFQAAAPKLWSQLPDSISSLHWKLSFLKNHTILTENRLKLILNISLISLT